MKKNFLYKNRLISLSILLLFAAVFAMFKTIGASAQEDISDPSNYEIVGHLVNEQGQPVESAEISAYVLDGNDEVLYATVESHEDGSWQLVMPLPPDNLRIEIDRPHYINQSFELSCEDLEQLSQNHSLLLNELVLNRKIDSGFWAVTAVFIFVLLIIALEKLHSTTASLAAMSAIFIISFIGGAISPDLYIFSFEQALEYINWEVIFLVMGMMIIVAVIEETGIFQWAAFQAYRISRGKSWLLVIILMLITGIASALLDNFTTMLLMTPISLQIAIAMGINPLAFIIPEILASNVAGISTLIGTPTNIIIGAYADIGFNDFLVNQTTGVLAAMAVMIGFVLFFYRSEWRKQSGEISPKLYELLKKNGEIRDKMSLYKAGIVFVLVLVGFVLGEKIHIPPAVPALVGATILFVWLKPDVNKTIEAVDWTTLVFFMSLFIVVGAVQEVGLISVIAGAMQRLVGDNLVLAVIVIVFGVGTMSTSIANIPLCASMLPIVEFLSGSVPGGSSKVLYYALSMGAAMGGNGLLIGGEANLVTSGIAAQAGQPISFKDFMKIGLPVTYLTLATGTFWLLVHFVF
jgi:Na+/H+ antiporter NhaD/arsenite permease-like protein